jgi:hypothetical protein
MPAFTVAKLKPLFPLVEQVCQELKELIDKNRNKGTVAERSDIQVVLLKEQIHRHYFGETGHTGATCERIQKQALLLRNQMHRYCLML